MTIAEDGAPSPPAGDPGWLEQARPRLRHAVHVGPALTMGASTVHFVADGETRAYLRVGPREAFLMTRLDGSRSLAEIGVEYATLFGRRLAAEHWQQLMSLLASRGLLEPADPARLDRIRETAERTRRSEGRTPLLRRMPIPGAVGLVAPAARGLGWLLRPFVAVPLGLAGITVCVLVALNFATVYAPLERGSSWPVTLAALLISWIMIGLHEIGHGVACHRYGGRPTEIGLMWRFPFLAFYCKVDDVVTFRKASHRVATSFAGVYVNLVTLVPVGLLWLWGPDSGRSHDLAAALLLFGTVTVLVNLLPVLQLDGYHMLEHATSTFRLQSESARFTMAFLRHGPAGIGGYPRRARWIHTGYTLLAAAVIGPALFLLVRLWFGTLAGLWGPVAAALVLLAEAVLVIAFLRWAVRRRRPAAD
ncbi:M50 family metallopeptidase [Actinomadura alba]|uniref:M50 family metallopeptidase n=1 Tax=Actinomadura alba TaxID=406431 RepID=A0ABR7LTJ6_9ACTN|nr:M50 family metallopeptidase [Actinomadura alba]MBC6467894.1 M50 family metallopeptidase [Actinomadura alba]